MSSSSTGFGTRQGGLAQSYRSGVAARGQVSPAPAKAAPAPAPYETPSWLKDDQGASSGGAPNLYALKHPVFMRWVSASIDFLILVFLTGFTMLAFDLVDGGLSSGGDVALLENGPLTLIVAVLWFGYGLLFESSAWQGTPGKKLTGLVITDMSGQRIGFGRSLGRAFAKAFSTIVPLYIPYIMVGATARKQSLHDKMCGTLVFRRHDLVHSNTVFD